VLVVAIADTHLPRGTRALPAACVERLRAADLVVHAGDVTSAAFLRELRELGPPVYAVHGNMDEPSLRAALPEELVVEAGEARIGVVHVPGPAAGREQRLVRRFPGCGAVVYGHTHLPQVELFDGVWILNPGSPTERRRAPAHSLLELRVDGTAIEPRLVEL
jgi:putative phosphoesterase